MIYTMFLNSHLNCIANYHHSHLYVVMLSDKDGSVLQKSIAYFQYGKRL